MFSTSTLPSMRDGMHGFDATQSANGRREARLSVFSRLLAWRERRRVAMRDRAIYREILMADDYRLCDMGLTRHDVARMLADMDRS